MPREASEVDDVRSTAAIRWRVKRVLCADPRTAYSEGELCELLDVEYIPVIHRSTFWFGRYEYREKTDENGVTWHYATPNWPFWLTAGTMAFFFGLWLMNTWGGWPWWLLEPTYTPGWVLRLARLFISVIPVTAVWMAYIWSFDRDPPEEAGRDD
jgi:hypothetical protein